MKNMYFLFCIFGMAGVASILYAMQLLDPQLLCYVVHAAWIFVSIFNMFVDVVSLFTDVECSHISFPFVKVQPFSYIMGSICVFCSSCASRGPLFGETFLLWMLRLNRANDEVLFGEDNTYDDPATLSPVRMDLTII